MFLWLCELPVIEEIIGGKVLDGGDFTASLLFSHSLEKQRYLENKETLMDISG